MIPIEKTQTHTRPLMQLELGSPEKPWETKTNARIQY